MLSPLLLIHAIDAAFMLIDITISFHYFAARLPPLLAKLPPAELPPLSAAERHYFRFCRFRAIAIDIRY